MKYYSIILAVLIIALSGCRSDEVTANMDVETYVELLRNNQYQLTTLPDFDPDDIPALLNYRNETDIVTVFPRNPISSFYVAEVELGVLILWSIEYIRVFSGQNDQHEIRFPSLNPILRPINVDESNPVSTEVIHREVASMYYSWWQANIDKDFIVFKGSDPLINSTYAWH